MKTDWAPYKVISFILCAVLVSIALTPVNAVKVETDRITSTEAHNSVLSVLADVERPAKYGAKMNEIIHTKTISPPTFQLPASLRVIEDEAFEGTAIISASLPDSLERIGERAFANISALRSVKIPDATQEIAKNAFAGSSQVSIIASSGSYASAYAKENGLAYVPLTMVFAENSGEQNTVLADIGWIRISVDLSADAERFDKTQQCRPIDDLKQELFDQCIANCIIGRASPACS